MGQKRALVALILLAAFGCGLLAGPHPCGAWHGGEKDRRSSSCHEGTGQGHGASARASVPSHGYASADCCNAFCQHACHATAVAEAGPPASAIAPVAQTTVEASELRPVPFAYAIDHIPLA